MSFNMKGVKTMFLISRGAAIAGKILAKKANIVTKDLAGGHADVTLTGTELMHDIIILTGAADAGFNVIFNASNIKSYAVINASGQIATLKNAAGTTVTVADGAVGIVLNDGTNIVTLSGLSGTAMTLAGVQTATNKTLTSPVLNTPVINGAVGSTFGSASEIEKDIAAGHADVVLTDAELLNDVIKLIGAGDAGFNLVLKATVKKTYLIDNQSGQEVTVKNAAGTTIGVATTMRAIVWNNGTDIIRITADA